MHNLLEMKMEPIEIQAQIFKIIRVNQELSLKSIHKMIKKELPNIKQEEILQALKELTKKIK